MEEMNIFKIFCKTQEALIPLHIPTELQLYNGFQNNTFKWPEPRCYGGLTS